MAEPPKPGIQNPKSQTQNSKSRIAKPEIQRLSKAGPGRTFYPHEILMFCGGK
jgi:hypothetical protein